MENILLQLGVGGIIVILVLKEVFAFLRNKGNGNSCDECKDLLNKLYEMHNQKDNDGVYIWYVRRSLEDAINKLADNIQTQTDIFKTLVMEIHKNKSE